MRQSGKGCDRRIARDNVVTDLAKDLQRVSVPLRRKRLSQRRAVERAGRIDVVPGIADTDGAAQTAFRAISGMGRDIFAFHVCMVIAPAEAEVRPADTCRKRCSEAATAKTDARDQTLVIGVHREIPARRVKFSPAAKSRAQNERTALFGSLHANQGITQMTTVVGQAADRAS